MTDMPGEDWRTRSLDRAIGQIEDGWRFWHAFRRAAELAVQLPDRLSSMPEALAVALRGFEISDILPVAERESDASAFRQISRHELLACWTLLEAGINDFARDCFEAGQFDGQDEAIVKVQLHQTQTSAERADALFASLDRCVPPSGIARFSGILRAVGLGGSMERCEDAIELIEQAQLLRNLIVHHNGVLHQHVRSLQKYREAWPDIAVGYSVAISLIQTMMHEQAAIQYLTAIKWLALKPLGGTQAARDTWGSLVGRQNLLASLRADAEIGAPPWSSPSPAADRQT